MKEIKFHCVSLQDWYKIFNSSTEELIIETNMDEICSSKLKWIAGFEPRNYFCSAFTVIIISNFIISEEYLTKLQS